MPTPTREEALWSRPFSLVESAVGQGQGKCPIEFNQMRQIADLVSIQPEIILKGVCGGIEMIIEWCMIQRERKRWMEGREDGD
jgi:hypothetical protein